MFILITGDTYNGFTYTGPFTSGDEARDYAKATAMSKGWRVGKMQTPVTLLKPKSLKLVRTA